MELKDIMRMRNWVVVGDTLNPEKYAAKIKAGLIEKGFTVSAVGKELSSINDVPFSIDVVDLCINPIKGYKLLKETEKTIGCVLMQPGASSDEIKALLDERNVPWLEGCALKGMQAYCN